MTMCPDRIIGLDIDKDNIAFCQKSGLNVLRGDALRLPFDTGSFDGIHSAQVMFVFHSRQAVQYVNELVRVVRPGGTVVISNLSDIHEVFEHPEVARPYPPGALLRMLHKPSASQVSTGTTVEGASFRDMHFRRPPVIDFRLFGSEWSWRTASILNAIQFGCYIRKYWTYRGYSIVLMKD